MHDEKDSGAGGPGCRLFVERVRLGFSGGTGQADFSIRTGIEQSRLAFLESSETELPSVSELAALGVAGVDLRFILTGIYEISPDESAFIDRYRSASSEDRGRQKAGATASEPSMMYLDCGLFGVVRFRCPVVPAPRR